MSPHEDYTTRSAASPDGTLRLEEHYQQDERMPARPYLRLVRAADGAEVFRLQDVSLAGEPDFRRAFKERRRIIPADEVYRERAPTL